MSVLVQFPGSDEVLASVVAETQRRGVTTYMCALGDGGIFLDVDRGALVAVVVSFAHGSLIYGIHKTRWSVITMRTGRESEEACEAPTFRLVNTTVH